MRIENVFLDKLAKNIEPGFGNEAEKDRELVLVVSKVVELIGIAKQVTG